MIKKDLLNLDLQFFAEENAGSPDGAENTEEQAGTPNETEQEKVMIPKSRFDEINQKYKDAQAKLDAANAEKQSADRKAQEESGEFKSLYETTSKEFSEFKAQYSSVEDRNKQLEGVINGLLETKLQSIPEDYRDLIPENLTPESKLEWINRAETKGLFSKAPQQPVGEQTNGSDKTGITKEQFSKMSYPERMKLFADNPNEYNRLTSK
ncbi:MULTISPECIES: hypothetical protein [Peribacillus]|uniref:hypothetical protein n=1 Tax=Peribacillus TaxID=2675229 RepID=UPI001F4E8B65|nr:MULTISPECIES: hypothetical protein [unclassified Peribacillus]MCK1985174.1 hypothetical protein [Peribacillus sp. Aquil_B1]MCK2007176.1 hypothetical protein [Peribacillus sp. Aquil_B8]